MGRVTSVDKNGDFNWQVSTESFWISLLKLDKPLCSVSINVTFTVFLSSVMQQHKQVEDLQLFSWAKKILIHKRGWFQEKTEIPPPKKFEHGVYYTFAVKNIWNFDNDKITCVRQNIMPKSFRIFLILMKKSWDSSLNPIFSWQTQTIASWDSVAGQLRKTKKKDWTELADEFLKSFHPDRVPMSLQLYGEKVSSCFSKILR